VNINEQMQELAHMGGLAYAPTDDVVSSLLAKTKRVRAVRQSTATLVGTVGALAIGIAAAQAYSAAKDDPAFRDRNVINNKNGLTPIELYRAKFGNENPTRAYDSGVDLSSIIARLKTAAAAGGSYPSGGSAVQPAHPAQQTPPPQVATKPADPFAKCKADHPDQTYKSYDCSTGKWVIKSGWYKDPANSSYYQCSAQPAYVGYTYDCATGKYVAKVGYFLFGNGGFYQAITWVDSATGVSSLGNWSGSGNVGGWDYKAILVDAGSTSYSEYVYMGGNATWSGSTCIGVTTSLFGTTVQASCLPDWKVDATGLIHKNSNGLSWIPLNQSLRWNACLGEFDDPSNPPAGWTWDGSSWLEAPSPTP
jgi:hypothetical protein